MNEKKPAMNAGSRDPAFLTPEMKSAIMHAEEEAKQAGEAFSVFAEELLNGVYSIERHLAVIARVMAAYAEKHSLCTPPDIEAIYKNEEKAA